MTNHQPLGNALLEEGLISTAQLDDALALQQQHGGRLGHILSALGHLKPLELYNILGKQQNIAWLNIAEEPADAALSSYDELHYYIAHQYMPWRIENGTMILACVEVTARLKHWAKRYYHDKVAFRLITPRDLTLSIKQHFASHIDSDTRNRLAEQAPEFSAKTTFQPQQRQSIIIALACLVALFVIAPHYTLIISLLMVNIFYIATISLKFFLYLFHKHNEHIAHPSQEDADLPIYTLLVPLYKEAASVAHIVDAIRAIEYPVNKLDVKLIVEADDDDTIQAIKQYQPESYFEIIHVPYSEPRTKPKACNYALTFARGRYVTIYDAEDKPEPNQLLKAIGAFRHYGPNTICLQARLNYYNRAENMMTKLFSIEYSSLFDFMLPGLQRLNMPIPLGGTSNHIDLKRLRAIGEWDPYNVTEDADLGMRLAMQGYSTKTLDSITMEEAPITFRAWVKQRSRWIKGYMQTWLVYMRRPKQLYRNLNPQGFWGFQLFIGGPCLSFLLAPFLWSLSLLWALGAISLPALPVWLLSLSVLALLMGIGCHLWFAIVAVRHWRWNQMGGAIVLFPFYWLLHSVASVKALWQLIFRPHFWEKTTHGLSQQLVAK